MTTPTVEMSLDVPCHRCGYDLRAQPEEGKCPECGAEVAEARQLAAIPRRPVWRESDPRWRRRMVVGAWLLVLLPLMEVLRAFGWASRVPVPNVFNLPGTIRTLNETFLSSGGVYEPLIFCMGVVLLFSKERGRRAGRLDWTRRWGVVCSYVVLLLSAAQILFLAALVLAGIAAVFQSMPPKYQPGVTQLFVDVSSGYLRYGAHPMTTAWVALVAFSCITILLAAIALFDALRSSGPKRAALILLAPLALFALMHLAQIALYCLGFGGPPSPNAFNYELYFWPQLLVSSIGGVQAGLNVAESPMAFSVEVAKWCIVLVVAVWLSVAQVAAWSRRKKSLSFEVRSSTLDVRSSNSVTDERRTSNFERPTSK